MAGTCFDGFTSHASSSKPSSSFFSGADTEPVGIGADSEWSVRVSSSAFLDLNTLGSTTSWVCTAGAGRPLRVLFRSVPPGPEKSPPTVPLGEVVPLSASFAVSIESSSPKLTFLSFVLALIRLYLLSRYFMTRRMSPSLRPKVLNTVGVISGNTLSSMES